VEKITPFNVVKRDWVLFALSLGIFVAVSWAAWRFAGFTEGEVMQGLIGVAAITAMIGCLAIAWFKTGTSSKTMLLLSLLLLVWQGARWDFWFRLQAEANSLASHLMEHRTMDGFTFRKGLQTHFAPPTFSDGNGRFQFRYFMDNPGTGYWYDSKTGWGYYPD
jgi:hypothetical protein